MDLLETRQIKFSPLGDDAMQALALQEVTINNHSTKSKAEKHARCKSKAEGMANSVSEGGVFNGMVFAFAGRFSATQTALKNLVERGGGGCAASVTQKVTHIITTQAAVGAEKRSAVIATAIGRGLPLLREEFLSCCVEAGARLALTEFSLGEKGARDSMVEGVRSAEEEEEKEQRRLKAAELKTQQRVQRRRLLAAFFSISDFASSLRAAQNRLVDMTRLDYLTLGLDAFVSLVRLKRDESKDATICALQADMAALQVQSKQTAQDLEQELQQERERVLKDLEQQRRASLEERALLSLRPPDDTRLRFVIDTNIFLHSRGPGEDLARLWDLFERKHCSTAKILIPQVVFEELDRKRNDRNDTISCNARAMMRFLERKFSASPEAARFWELQDREVDDAYRRKINQSGCAGNRSCDLRIFYFVRDVHRQRPGCLMLVTNDQPLALECGSVGVPTMAKASIDHLFEMTHVHGSHAEMQGCKAAGKGSVHKLDAAIEKLEAGLAGTHLQDRKGSSAQDGQVGKDRLHGEAERQRQLAAVHAADLKRAHEDKQEDQQKRAEVARVVMHAHACAQQLSRAGGRGGPAPSLPQQMQQGTTPGTYPLANAQVPADSDMWTSVWSPSGWYWWNRHSNETTDVNAPKPQTYYARPRPLDHQINHAPAGNVVSASSRGLPAPTQPAPPPPIAHVTAHRLIASAASTWGLPVPTQPAPSQHLNYARGVAPEGAPGGTPPENQRAQVQRHDRTKARDGSTLPQVCH